MTALAYQFVIDEISAELASRRRARIERHAAYVALARALLEDANTEQNLCSTMVECRPGARDAWSSRMSLSA